jgi:hypothetical protein
MGTNHDYSKEVILAKVKAESTPPAHPEDHRFPLV